MFLNENTIQNHLNIVKVCALHCIWDAIAFFRYIYASSRNSSRFGEQNQARQGAPRGGHG